jgi:hypothetical protein
MKRKNFLMLKQRYDDGIFLQSSFEIIQQKFLQIKSAKERVRSTTLNV